MGSGGSVGKNVLPQHLDPFAQWLRFAHAAPEVSGSSLAMRGFSGENELAALVQRTQVPGSNPPVYKNAIILTWFRTICFRCTTIYL